MTGKVLVLGATGTVGTILVQELARRGVTARAATRDPSKYGKQPNVEPVAFDLQNGATFKGALDGVDALFLLTPPGHAQADRLVAPFLDAALPKVKRVVTMTAAGVDASDEIPLRKIEKTVERSGAAWTHVRPTWFMQNFNTFWFPGIQATGNIMVPAAEAKTAFVDARDIAAVAATVLTTDGHEKKAYTVTGGEALTYGSAAQILTRETGRKIGYLPVDDGSFKAGLVKAGLPEDYASMMVTLFQNVRAGYAANVSPDVKNVTGSAPRTLVDYARTYKNHFAAGK